jgi:hypothetical protein
LAADIQARRRAVAFEHIPDARWIEFLASFNRQHAGWLVTLEDAPWHGTPRVLLRDVPLVGVTTDPHRLVIGVAGAQGHLDHVVANAINIWRAYMSDGSDLGLDIEGAGGVRLRLRFRAAARPDLVDGVYP